MARIVNTKAGKASQMPRLAPDRPHGSALLLSFQFTTIGCSDFAGIKCAVQTWSAHPWSGVMGLVMARNLRELLDFSLVANIFQFRCKAYQCFLDCPVYMNLETLSRIAESFGQILMQNQNRSSLRKPDCHQRCREL